MLIENVLPLALTGRESPLKATPMMNLESGLSSSETHSESEEVTENGHHIEHRGGGCEFVNPVHVQQV